MIPISKEIQVALNRKWVSQVCPEGTVDSNSPTQGIWAVGFLYQPLSLSIFNT